MVVVGRGVSYEQFEKNLDGKKNTKKYSTCYTNEGMLRYKDDSLTHEPHIFIPCKDYYRYPDAKGTPNTDVCIPKERAKVNGETLGKYIIKTGKSFEAMSTDPTINFHSPVGGNIYDITVSKDDKCNKYWKSAKEVFNKMDPSKLMDLSDGVDIIGTRYPDVLIVVEAQENVEKWKDVSKAWLDNGKGPGIGCYNYAKLSKHGICQTASEKYSWGFCSPSCSASSSLLTLNEGMTKNEVLLEMAEFRYYEETGYNKYTGYEIWDETIGKMMIYYTLFHIQF